MNSKKRILHAAETVFRQKGFSGASMSDIARRAQVSKGLIYHHYGSKKELWRAMVSAYFTRSGIMERFYQIVARGDISTLEDFAVGEEGFFHFLKNNPGLVRMMNWLNLEDEADPGFPNPDTRRRVTARIRELVDAGVFRSDVDPVVLPIVYMSICVNWFSSRWKYMSWFEDETDPGDVDRRFIQGAIDILKRGTVPDETR